MTSTIKIKGQTGNTGNTGATGTFSGVVYQNLIPYTDNNVSLGDTSHYFNGLFVNNMTLSIQDITFTSVSNSLTINTGATIVTGNITIQGTQESTSTSTGAIKVTGGVGIGANLTVGGNTILNGVVSQTLDASRSNTQFGYNAYPNAELGGTQFNTAVGVSSLQQCVSGNYNTAIGYNAGASVVKSNNNTAIGVSTIQNKTFSNNTAIGSGAGNANYNGLPTFFSNCVLYYPFNADVYNYATGVAVSDASLVSTGALNNTTYYIGNGSLFNNSITGNSGLRLINNIPANKNGYSFSCWFQKTDASSCAMFVISDTYNLNSQNRYSFYVTQISSPYYLAIGGFGTYVVTTTQIALNTWYHAAWTLSPSGVSNVYLNGSLIQTITTVPYVSMALNSGVLMGDTNSATSTVGFKGYLDDFRYYDSVLSAAQIQVLYNYGNLSALPISQFDLSANNNMFAISRDGTRMLENILSSTNLIYSKYPFTSYSTYAAGVTINLMAMNSNGYRAVGTINAAGNQVKYIDWSGNIPVIANIADTSTNYFYGIDITSDGNRIIVSGGSAVSATKVMFSNWNGTNFGTLNYIDTGNATATSVVSDNYPAVAISPDGSYCAFVGQTNKNVYIGTYDSVNARYNNATTALTTALGFTPYLMRFSPDNKYLFISSSGSIYYLPWVGPFGSTNPYGTTTANLKTLNIPSNPVSGSNIFSLSIAGVSGENVMSVWVSRAGIKTFYKTDVAINTLNYTDCSGCTFIGANTDTALSGVQQSTAIGYGAQITGSNQVVLGTASENVIIPGNMSASNMSMYRNRIINGDMRIAQRSTSASTTNGSSGYFSVDRWLQYTASGSYTSSQNALTTTDLPYLYGFRYSQKLLVVTGSSNAMINQFIEANYLTDLAWGVSTANSVTISYWFRSNVATGSIFCNTLAVMNNAGSEIYSYASQFVYTVSSGSWQYVTVTIPAPPANFTPQQTLTSTGLRLFVLSYWSGSNTGINNTWITASGTAATANATNWCSTAGNYVEFTGVQLEKGTVATPFEFRMNELQLCQRYFFSMGGSAYNYEKFSFGQCSSATNAYCNIWFPVPLRAGPTSAILNAAGNFMLVTAGGGGVVVSSFTVDSYGTFFVCFNITSATGLVAGNATMLQANNTTAARIFISAEL